MNYEHWLETWGVSSKGTPYREAEDWEGVRNMGVKADAKGHHFWINRWAGPGVNEFTWSVGHPTEGEAKRSLHGYLYGGETAGVIVTLGSTA